MGFEPQCQAPREVMELVGHPLNPQCFFLIGNQRNIINEKSKEKYKLFMMMNNKKRKKKTKQKERIKKLF